MTRDKDSHRPVLDTSGYAHRVAGADIYDSHSYEQDPARFALEMDGLDRSTPHVNRGPKGEEWSLPYAGQPYFCSEFGGIWWDAQDLAAAGQDRSESWGYGDRVRSESEWFARFEGLFGVLLSNPRMFGLCYTQLTDFFQEKNGLYTFDRQPKFDLARLRVIINKPAAYEDLAT